MINPADPRLYVSFPAALHLIKLNLTRLSSYRLGGTFRKANAEKAAKKVAEAKEAEKKIV